MSGHGVPHPYRAACRLDAYANSMLADSRAKWHTLSDAQRLAIMGASPMIGGLVLSSTVPKGTADSLVADGLVEPSTLRHHRVTSIGCAVRDAGVYTRTEAAT